MGHRLSLRSLSRIAILTLAATLPSLAAAQAGTSTVSGEVYDNTRGTAVCSQMVGPAPAVAATCPPTTAGSNTGSFSGSASNAARSVTAEATLRQTSDVSGEGLAHVSARQASSLTAVGGPGGGDQVVFHFMTNAQAHGRDGRSIGDGAVGLWEFLFQAEDVFAYASDGEYADARVFPARRINAQRTSLGYDVFVPYLGWSELGFVFEASAVTYNSGDSQPNGTTVTAFTSTTLLGVDVLTSDGAFFSSAVFDPQTGRGVIQTSSNVVTPEPATMLLLATGLLGIGAGRRRRRGR